MEEITSSSQTLSKLAKKLHSSLTYLQRLPVTTLKIDKSFIDHMLANQTDTMIIKTINLAKIMGMTVIAEGVEM